MKKSLDFEVHLDVSLDQVGYARVHGTRCRC